MNKDKMVFELECARRHMINFTDGRHNIVIKTIDQAIDFIKQQDEALKLMVYQYCTYQQNGKEVLSHRFMTAGEHAFAVLGYKEGQSAEELAKEIL